MRLNRFTLLLAAILFFAFGCQSSHNPAAPKLSTDPTTNSIAQVGSDVRSLWGYFNCEADLTEGTISVIPSRSTDIHINATRPLNKAVGIGFTIDPSSTPATGYFVVNVNITHPFNGAPSLTGFDVRGILLGYGSYNASGLVIPGPGDIQLVNADGWSRWWNPTEFTTPGIFGYEKGTYAIHELSGPPTSMLNPYKAFADGLWATADVDFLTTVGLTEANGRAVFRSGKTNSRQYKIQFPVSGGPKVRFDYTIDASWAQSTPNPPVNIPADFPIWANGMEAFIVDAVVDGNSILGTPFGGAASGQLQLTVQLWDWQGWQNGSYDSQIGSIRLLSPGIVFDIPSVIKVDGLHFTTLTITAPALEATEGTHPVVIEFPAPGTSWKQAGATAPSGEIASYAVVSADVGSMECTADTNNICEEAVQVNLVSTKSGVVCMPFDGTDYYTFTVDDEIAVDGTITLDNFNYGDNDLILLKGCPGDIIDMSLTPYSDTEVIQIDMLEIGTYYISVIVGETAGADVQPYKLVLDLEKSGQICTPDNNNDSAGAQMLGLVDNVAGSVCAGGDIHDWYTITVPANKVAGGSIFLDNQSSGNIDIRVYEEYPGPITYWGTQTGPLDELVNIGALGPGAHYIEIFALGSSPTGDRPYSMDLSLLAADYNCASGDGNDSYFTADPVTYTSVVNGTVCFPADPDWFIFEVPDNAKVSGTMTLSGAMIADNDIFLYGDPEAEPIAYSNKVGSDDEVVTVEDLATGTYYVKCAAHPNVGQGDQQYTLTMALTEKSVGDYDFEIHAHIVRQNDGSGPATSDAKVQQDVNWANEFYGQWGGSVTLAQISYIDHSSWLAASWQEIYTADNLYSDTSGPINVYYVNSFTDMGNAAAYTIMDCRPIVETHNYTYVVMSDYGSNMVLAHELGHAFAILLDLYLLDMGYSSCSQIKGDYCAGGNTLSYCKEGDAYQGNLMWFTIQNWNDPEDYWLSDTNWQNPVKPIDSQVENWTYFHTNYPNNF